MKEKKPSSMNATRKGFRYRNTITKTDKDKNPRVSRPKESEI